MKKLLSIVLITMILTAASAVTQAELNSKMEDFGNLLADYVPRATTQTNLWADAHIGNLLPLNGLPHLGAGLSFGGALIPTDLMSVFDSAFTDPVPSWEYFPLPAMSIDARVGGIILPFDIGVHLMSLEDYEAEFYGIKVEIANSLVYGADLRFAILQEGVVVPALSIGVGYTYASGDFTITSEKAIPTDLSDLTSLFSDDAYMQTHLEYNTNIYSATVQLSKKILLLTPFVGAKAVAQQGLYTGWGVYEGISGVSNAYGIDYEIEKEFSFDNLANSEIQYSVFAGLGVDFLIVQTTAGVNYDFKNKTWAGSISLHVKI